MYSWVGFVFVVTFAGAVYGFPLNDKKVPEGVEDWELIEETLVEAIEKAEKATVCIDLGEGTGTGVIVSPEGLVMTAAHVSTGVGKKVGVILPDGTELKAETLGLMAEVDAALVQILDEYPGGGDFPTVEIDRADRTKLGDWIFSLGHSGGSDVKRGAVARLGRLVRVANDTIQTDGTLIGGDSGGPLFDMEGRLIGIHSRVGPQTPVNMHVPVDVFLEGWDRMLASEFIGEGPFATKPEKGRGFLGVGTEDSSEGLKVTQVGKDSVAFEAGVEVGDILKKLNEAELPDRKALKEILKEMAEGDKLVLELIRGGEEKSFEMRLGVR